MASTVPAKSQPLHNFALPHLKWKKNHHSNNHHRGRCTKLSSPADADSASSPSPHDSPQRQSHSPMREAAPPRLSPMRRDDSGSDSGKNRKVTAHRRSPQNTAPENGKNGALASSPDRRSKILLKLPRKTKAEESHQERKGDEGVGEEATAELVSKTWNLRPRKPTHKSMNGDQFKAGGSSTHENTTQSCHRNVIEPNSSERKKRLRFSIPLSREEIEDDIFALTGSKPARRPKKRAKGVQKQLDSVFPGLWLASITPDSYKVAENMQKV